MSTNGPIGHHDPRARIHGAAAPQPIAFDDPWAHLQPVTRRRRADPSVVVAALVMMSLAVGVVVGIAML